MVERKSLCDANRIQAEARVAPHGSETHNDATGTVSDNWLVEVHGRNESRSLVAHLWHISSETRLVPVLRPWSVDQRERNEGAVVHCELGETKKVVIGKQQRD